MKALVRKLPSRSDWKPIYKEKKKSGFFISFLTSSLASSFFFSSILCFNGYNLLPAKT
jgi:hypothetical protein